MSALRMVTTPPGNLAEVVTTSTRLDHLRSLAGRRFQHDSFLKSSVQRITLAHVSRNAPMEVPATSPDSALDLSGAPGTGRFLF